MLQHRSVNELAKQKALGGTAMLTPTGDKNAYRVYLQKNILLVLHGYTVYIYILLHPNLLSTISPAYEYQIIILQVGYGEVNPIHYPTKSLFAIGYKTN